MTIFSLIQMLNSGWWKAKVYYKDLNHFWHQGSIDWIIYSEAEVARYTCNRKTCLGHWWLAVKYLLNIQSAEYLQFKYLVTVNNSCQKKHINMPRELIPNFLDCIYVNKARFNMCCVVPGEYISMFYVMVVQNSWNILKTLFNLKTYFKYRQMEILWDSSTQQSANVSNLNFV